MIVTSEKPPDNDEGKFTHWVGPCGMFVWDYDSRLWVRAEKMEMAMKSRIEGRVRDAVRALGYEIGVAPWELVRDFRLRYIEEARWTDPVTFNEAVKSGVIIP